MKRRNIWKDEDNQLYYLKARIKKEKYWICEYCKRKVRTSDVHVHHKDRNRKNNHLLNLMVLDKTCHVLIHQGSSPPYTSPGWSWLDGRKKPERPDGWSWTDKE